MRFSWITLINYLGVARIEGERGNSLAQVEHPPRPAGVQADISAGHVAELEHDVRVVGLTVGRNMPPAPPGPMILHASNRGAGPAAA